MLRTYLDSSVLIHAVQGADGGKALRLLEDATRDFVAATFLKVESGRTCDRRETRQTAA